MLEPTVTVKYQLASAAFLKWVPVISRTGVELIKALDIPLTILDFPNNSTKIQLEEVLKHLRLPIEMLLTNH